MGESSCKKSNLLTKEVVRDVQDKDMALGQRVGVREAP